MSGLSVHTTHTLLDSPSASDSDREAPPSASPPRPWRNRTFSAEISGELESLKASLASAGAESRAQSAARWRTVTGVSVAAVVAAAVSALVVWGVLRTAAERIEFSMTVRGVDFVQLSSYPTLCSEVKGKIREVVVTSAAHAISPENVAVVLAAGSVVAHTTVYPQAGLDVGAVQSSLGSCASLGSDVAAAIAGIRGIKAVSTGPVSVSDISFISHVPPASAPTTASVVPTTDVTPAPVPSTTTSQGAVPSTTTSARATTSTRATMSTKASAMTTTSTTVRTTSTRRSVTTVVSATTATFTDGQTVDMPECGSAEANVRYIASEVHSIPEVPSEAECCIECRAFPADQGGCTAWTWESESDTCVLKGGSSDRTPVTKVAQPGVVSGLVEGRPEGGPVPFLSVPSAGPSLFCWSLVLPGTYEEQLLKMQHAKNLSIFGCDGWDVYSNMSLTLDRGLKTRIVDSDLTCDIGGEFMTALNTEIFLAVWSKVFSDKRYHRFQWTVKVDPDTVWFPERLRARLARWHEQEEGTYLNNCRFGLHGPIEVFSRNALKTFEKDLAAGKDEARCVKEQEWALWGEDLFVDQCFINVLKVNRINDFALICEDHCDCPEWDSCHVEGKVAFHPFKTVDDYLACLENAATPEPLTAMWGGAPAPIPEAG